MKIINWSWWNHGIVLIVAFGLSAFLGWKFPTTSSTNLRFETQESNNWSSPIQPAYIGSNSCAECHPEQASAFQSSGHGRTFFGDDLAERFAMLNGREWNDPQRSGVLKFAIEGSHLFAEFTDGSRRQRQPVQFAVGSGTHATTFVTLLDEERGEPRLLEHRLTLFDNGQRLDLTPSHSETAVRDELDFLGRTHQGKDAKNCIACHTTTARIHGREIDDLRGNVSCESCHGPGRSHAAGMQASQSDTAIRFAKGGETPMQEIQMCGRCHRTPEMLSSPPSKSDPKLARFQPVGLLNSNCFRRSTDRLRCTTCHDPHQTVDTVAENYTEKCRKCHSNIDEGNKVCPQSPLEKCVVCHMPPVQVHPGISFHDHWIRVHPNPVKSE
jgi:Cytochrome c554 and c-prime